MHHLNQVTTKGENKIIDSDRHYVPCIFTKPREEPREFNLEEGFAKQKM